MQETIVTTLLLPLALGFIMLGLGFDLAIADFKRVLIYPKAVLIGLAVQMLLLTPVAFGLAMIFRLPPELAVGLMLLAASPGGATANIFSDFARGDVALSITLTAINSALCLLTLPLIVQFALGWFMQSDQYIAAPFRKVVDLGLIIIVPVLFGMTIRAQLPGIAARAVKPMRVLSVLLLVGLIGWSVRQEWGALPTYFAQVGLACLAFNLISMGAGYYASLTARLPSRQAIAIAMEIGVHNGALAFYIALTVLGSAAISIPVAVYSLISVVTAGMFATYLARRHCGRLAQGIPSTDSIRW
jgi:BASS family bile acid:Na+ symporter